MTYLSKEQCRAARGLLGWTQQDLATQTGLSKTAINNFERGISNIKTDTLTMIHTALTQEGLIFLTDDGLQRRKESSQIVHGTRAITALFDDIIDQSTPLIDDILIGGDSTVLSDATFKKNLRRLKARAIPMQFFEQSNQGDHALASFCYGLKLGFLYLTPPIALMIDSPQAQRAEKARLQQTGKPSLL